MRLTKIKLAGFKSFVDPTVLHVPSNLVGVVGPNGCGKSNIIDAVRWVMGESSARSLRGGSMADVIFNGSSARKPVGQASIELVFDNSLGRVGGAWINFNEIAIKRLVNRDGQSIYYINGSRCRRRDITDIFLGTGLGPRSYAIIEQGMISQIIEAKPEELRIFFEEAAGISKYKERRRETESRIRNTRDNLDRLSDLREELDKQLRHLHRQAKAAEKYKEYKAEERRLKAELLALRWRVLDTELGAREADTRRRETELEAAIAEMRHVEAGLETGRAEQSKLTELFNGAQERYYRIGTEITRLEQQLTHRRELRRRQREELGQSEQALEEILREIRADEQRITELEGALHDAEPALAAARRIEEDAGAQFERTEAKRRDWQAAWDAFSGRGGEVQRLVEVERTRIEHLERQQLQQERRLERLRLERDTLGDATGIEEMEALRAAEQAAAEALAQAQEELARVDRGVGELRQAQRDLSGELDEIRERAQAGRGRLASLETLQEAALGRGQVEVREWLKTQGLEQRLVERLKVEPGWEQAVETALGPHLEAVCVDAMDDLSETLAQLERGSLALFELGGKESGDRGRSLDEGALVGTLLSKVEPSWLLQDPLAGVRLAASLEEALARRRELGERESWITPDGVWLGRRWLRLVRTVEDGVLVREREIHALNRVLEEDAGLLKQRAEVLERARIQLHNFEESRNAIHEEITHGNREHARLQAQANAQGARLEQGAIRRRSIDEEREELSRQTIEDQEALREARMRLEEALGGMEHLVAEREELLGRQEALREASRQRRAEAESARQQVQKQALAVESQRVSLGSTRQALERLEVQRKRLQQRREQLAEGLASEEDPVVQERLEACLENRLEAESELTEARRGAQEQEAALRQLEQSRHDGEKRAQDLRQALENERLAMSESSVRRQTLRDQLRELDLELATVLAQLPAEAEESQWQGDLEHQAKRIQRLGAINLAAIDEFAELSERKRFLDAQNDDLMEALGVLEDAIRKIDRETRGRFRDTFERIDQGLQTLFPRLFGGGRGHLELTGEDVLDAGVAIMAQPPGKRISNIHLLSGGEKALTAVALVFAIFQLNPAPFCLLDEVDAPLDDANVERLGEMLREMSEGVQFIFITHNKITMAIARHLSGVTMHEPGVSRLVAVDVDEAVKLAAV